MIQKYNALTVFLLVLSMFFSSCEKEGKMVITPITDIRSISFKGFVLGDTLEQYFDGVKMRNFYGRAGFTGNITYENQDAIKMELKKKGTNEVLYTYGIEKDRDKDKPVRFFYDGKKVTEGYHYPEAIEEQEQIAFYFDFPAGMPVDIAYGDGSDINAMEYLAKNVQPKQWTEFIKIPQLEGEMYVFLLKAGKKEYLLENDAFSSVMSGGIQLPNKYGYPGGGVQSWYVGIVKDGTGKSAFFPQEDLVALFPR
ncbi:hypothetical protein [Pedobacter caeni]|uniref:Uncharacterized protein n=1 Tax=Pedobacter caeni TaxID=288992 RepID=A0A1M4Z5S1_9SPHI|nr:hypothetical protein [Pedobacter caeni]SHF13409.1 hypothetical protein SAMN04488522_102199 [Pedobacter caeni]